MIQMKVEVNKFRQNAEKTGWTYFELNPEQSLLLNPENKKAFKLRGTLNGYPVKQLAAIPNGSGGYIVPLKAALRKQIRIVSGMNAEAVLERDEEVPELNADLQETLELDEQASEFFGQLSPSHRRYFSKWIEEAKTEETRAKRLTMALDALSRKLGFPEMMREKKKSKD